MIFQLGVIPPVSD